MSTIIGIAVIAAAAALAYWYADSRTAREVRLTDMAAEHVIRRAVQEIGVERRWTATGHSRDYASFAYRRHASCPVSLLLLLLFVVPGVIYALVYRKTQTLTINVFAEADGTSTVAVSGSGAAANARGRRFLRGLPDPSLPSSPTHSAERGPMQATPALLPAPSDVEVDTPSDFGYRRCVRCRTELPAQHRFCGACGAEQPA